ncbi:MAG: hypothetical protein JNK16_02730 [Phycisphaerales bacterium]|nr:hypothetical protein [Phycisphaerales bacterium]
MKRLSWTLSAFTGLVSIGLIGNSVASAQTLLDGNAKFQMLTTTFSVTNGDTFFYTDGTTTDWQYKYCWYYRTENNNQNSLFSKLDTPSVFTQNNKSRITYTNAGPGVAGNERFNTEFLITLRDGPVANQARVYTRVRFTASSANAAARTFNIFHLCDMDMPGGSPNASTDDRQTWAGNTGTFSETSSLNKGTVASDGSEFLHDVATGLGLRNLLSSGANNLSNNSLQVNGDGAFGYQWQWTLAPGESQQVRVGQAINTLAYTTDPCSADLNRDNAVDDSDFVSFAMAYDALLCPALPAFCDADLNDDDQVDDADFVIFATQYDTLVCPW